MGAGAARVLFPHLAPRPRWARAPGSGGVGAPPARRCEPAGPARRCRQVLPGGRLPAPRHLCRPGSLKPRGLREVWGGLAGPGRPGLPAAGPPRCLPVGARPRQPGESGRWGETPEPSGTPPHSLPPLLGSAEPQGAFDLRNRGVELGRGRTERSAGDTGRERDVFVPIPELEDRDKVTPRNDSASARPTDGFGMEYVCMRVSQLPPEQQNHRRNGSFSEYRYGSFHGLPDALCLLLIVSQSRPLRRDTFKCGHTTRRCGPECQGRLMCFLLVESRYYRTLRWIGMLARSLQRVCIANHLIA